MPSVPTSGSVPPPPPVWDARPPETTVRYAGFWIRVVAALVDSIILGILWEIINLVFPAPPAPPMDADYDEFIKYINLILSPEKIVTYAVLAWAYFALQESSSAQATVGKRLLGLRVSKVDGSRLSLGGATIRVWPMYLPTIASLPGFGFSSLVSLLAFIACVAVAFSARKQGLHDKMAGAILTRR
jgi:uncharacterized RDD family membrane protein YckC